MKIVVTTKGNWDKTRSFLDRMQKRTYLRGLEKYGKIGVDALSRATPLESGGTSEAWYYEIVDKPGYFSIHWLNSHIEEPGAISIAAILQYGHGTRNGGYVQGRDYINPAMRPIFDQIVNDMWREVTR